MSKTDTNESARIVREGRPMIRALAEKVLKDYGTRETAEAAGDVESWDMAWQIAHHEQGDLIDENTDDDRQGRQERAAEGFAANGIAGYNAALGQSTDGMYGEEPYNGMNCDCGRGDCFVCGG